MSNPLPDQGLGISGRIARFFQSAPITPLLMVGILLLGAFALVVTPREEEPQVNVTLATVTIPFPGASAKQVEQTVTIPGEQLLSQISDIEHISSVSRPGVSLITLQFEVGVPRTEALVRVHDVIQSNKDFLPAGLGIGEPIVRSKGIDDVPVLTLTLYSKKPEIGAYELEKVAHSLELELKQIDGTREINTIGGPTRQITINLDSDRMRASGITVVDIQKALQSANYVLPAGYLIGGNRKIAIEAGRLVSDTREIANLVVGMHQGRTVQLGGVAEISDGPPQPDRYAWLGIPVKGGNPEEYPAVTVQITKKPGSDASLIAFEVKRKLEDLKNTLIPPEVEIAVTRDDGAIGMDKTLRLIHKLIFATTAVVVMVWLLLGWRQAVLVGSAITLTLLMMLFASWAVGYTLNRVSLFALIFAVGILVDDAIVVGENIHRHMLINPNTPMTNLIPRAVDEVGGPTILATLAVIAALMPILAVGGMMGGFSHPIGITPSIGMMLSLGVAFVITPWMARWVLKPSHRQDTLTAKAAPLLKKVVPYFLSEPYGTRNRLLLFLTVPLLILVTLALPALKIVVIRGITFDNRAELEIVVDLPPDATVERTAALLREASHFIASQPEVKSYQAYAGLSSPIGFTGLARQYYLRNSSEYGSLFLNLIDKHKRKASSHEIAARLKPGLHRIAEKYNAELRVVEPAPGPPELATLLAEVYGPEDGERMRIARQIKDIFSHTKDVNDVFDSTIAKAPKLDLVVDRQKAALLGVDQEDVVTTLRAGLAGDNAAFLHDASKYPAALHLQLAPGEQASIDSLLRLSVRTDEGNLVPISELVNIQEDLQEQPIFHKDLRPVVYVGGNVGGKLDSPLYPMFAMRKAIHSIKTPDGGQLEDSFFLMPTDTQNRYSIKWDGEWHTSYQTFGDLGFAFCIALIVIYLLIVAHFGSYLIPAIIMVPIPLTIIGVIPGHLVTGAQISTTSGIGMLALAGIIVRNAILLVDFIRIETARGKSLEEAVVDAPLVRAQPILLTAMAAMLSGYFILGDQTFDGLGTTLIFGVLASTLLTLVLIPLLYYHFYHNRRSN